MISTKLFSNTYKFALYILLSLVFVWIISHDIGISKDSDGYLQALINRSAAYPLFLKTMKFLFGSFFNSATIIIQGIIGVVAIASFVNSLKKTMKMDAFWYILMAAVLSIPYVYNQNVANMFLSEALAYPLYLLVISKLILGFSLNEKKYFWQAVPLLLVLLLTRSQFLYLIPICILILLWLFSFKNTILLLCTFLIVPLMSSVLDKTYHYFEHDEFISTPWTSLHLLTPALFVADADDISLFEKPIERTLFSKLHDTLSKRKLNLYTLSSKKDPIGVFTNRYSDIANGTIYNFGKLVVAPTGSENERYIALEKQTIALVLPLILKNFKQWVSLYMKNFILGFGNAKQLLLTLIILCFCVIKYIKTNSAIFGIITLCLSFVIANIALVAIGMHTIKRFTFYNDWVLFLIVFILLNQLYTNHLSEKSNK